MKIKKSGIIICVVAIFVIAWVASFLMNTFAEAIINMVFPSYVVNGEFENDEALTELNLPEPINIVTVPETYDSELSHIVNITYNNIKSINSFDTIKNHLYNIDSTAYVYDNELDFDNLLIYNPNVDLFGEGPKVLIFHTHSQEDFIDSRPNEEADTIVGVGDVLAEILKEKYGVSALHHKGIYDVVDGVEARGGSYEVMEPDIQRVLKENPSIEIMIDLHRDALPDNRKLITEIDGKSVAQIMFFNGICRRNVNGEAVDTGLVNEFLEENLSVSLKTKLLANELYPGYTRKNYIKPYRYSLHMKPNSFLIEVGSNTNTVEEAKLAMYPLADILVRTFK